MADGHRRYPVDILVMHHSVGPEFSEATDLTVQDWFDQIGAGRGYKGKDHSYHKHPSRDKETFSQAHYALRKYTKDGNKYGWRLTLLMEDPWNNVAWHAGNWEINRRSIGIETCGNFVSVRLPEKALMLVADTFRDHDKRIGGVLSITPHRKYMATACPGLIADQLPTLVDMINRPDVWNSKLWLVTDNLYRVFDGTNQVGSYREKTNAFDKWLTNRNQTVKYNGKNLTSEFNKMANTLERTIADLRTKLESTEQSLKRVTDEMRVCISFKTDMERKNKDLEEMIDQKDEALRLLGEEITQANSKIADLESELNILKNTDRGQLLELTKQLEKAEAEKEQFLSSFLGQLYLIFNRNKR